MLAKLLLAGRISCAYVSMFAFVGFLVYAKFSACHKLLPATLPVARLCFFMSMSAFNVLLQMLVVQIGLVTALIGAFKWSLMCVRIEMGSQSCWPVESLVTTLVGAFYGFLQGTKCLSHWSWGKRSDRGICILLGVRIGRSIIFSIVVRNGITIIELLILIIVLKSSVLCKQSATASTQYSKATLVANVECW
jgi:hypothetical protein